MPQPVCESVFRHRDWELLGKNVVTADGFALAKAFMIAGHRRAEELPK